MQAFKVFPVYKYENMPLQSVRCRHVFLVSSYLWATERVGQFSCPCPRKKQTMSSCKEGLDPRTLTNFRDRTFRVPLLRVKGAKVYKHSHCTHCSLKVIFWSVYGWSKCHVSNNNVLFYVL